MYRLSRIGKGSRKGIGREVKEARTTTKLSPDHVTRSDDDFSFLRFSLSFSALRSKKKFEFFPSFFSFSTSPRPLDTAMS